MFATEKHARVMAVSTHAPSSLLLTLCTFCSREEDTEHRPVQVPWLHPSVWSHLGVGLTTDTLNLTPACVRSARSKQEAD